MLKILDAAYVVASVALIVVLIALLAMTIKGRKK